MGKSKNVNVKAAPAGKAEENALVPLVDIYEQEDGTTVLVAEVPGAAPESLDVRVDKGVLTIAAEAKCPPVGEDMREIYRSFTGGQYFRAFALSDETDRDHIEAACADGVLTLKLPKAAAAKTRKIEIKD